MSSRVRRWAAAAAVACFIPSLAVALSPGAAEAACTSPITIPDTGAPSRADQTSVFLSNTNTSHTAPSTAIAWSPRAIGTDVVTRNPATGVDTMSKHLTMAYSAAADVPRAPFPTDSGARVSADSGATFTAAPATVPASQLGEIGHMLDGRLLAIRFVANGWMTSPPAGSPPGVRFPVVLNISGDKGRTWSPVSASTGFLDSELPAVLPIRKGSALNGVRAAGRPIQMTNGTVVLPIYLTMWNGKYNRDGSEQGILFSAVLTAVPGFAGGRGSVDTSAPWNFTMHPVSVHSTVSFNEFSVVERQDGRLLAVIRQEGPVAILTYRVSSDSGATWTASTPVSFIDQPGCAVSGVYPQLTMMPTGQLVLSSGRPDNWLAISTDPSGTRWTQAKRTYWNAPVAGGGGQWWWGSSGYTALVPTASNRLLQFADNCAAPNESGVNGCASDLDFDHDDKYRIVNRQVSVLPPDPGKIDLVGKLAHGTAKLTTDMTGVAPVGAVTPPTPYGSSPSPGDATSTNYWSKAEGALDGSNAFWSGALSGNSDGTGTYELMLDRTYNLTKLGLSLLPGVAAGARVATSADGQTWTPAALTYPDGVTAPGETGLIRTSGDRALRYYTVKVTAKYVRVTTEASSCAAVGGSDACSMINELELYSTVNSFENEASIPRGFANVTCTRLTSPAANGDTDHDSTNAARLHDRVDPIHCDGAHATAGFSYIETDDKRLAATSRTLQAAIRPLSNENGILFSINGRSGTNTEPGAVYHLGINDGNRWMAWTRATNKWVGLGGAPVPLNAWTTFKIVADTGGATLYTVDAGGNPTEIGKVPRAETAEIKSITGYTISSGSSQGVGDQAVIDDMSFE